MANFNVIFERRLLKTLREDLKKLGIKIPKVEGLGCYFTIGNNNYEVDDDGSMYSKRYHAIYKYLEKERPKENQKLEEYSEKMLKELKK